MTFEEWFDTYNNDFDGFWDRHLGYLAESGQLTPDRVKSLMDQAYETGYNTCRDNWGGLDYSDPANNFTNGLRR